MERIGVRQLRQHASKWLERVAAGESLEVTDRGRPVARLVPVRDSGLERLIAEGRARRATAVLLGLGPPLKPRPGKPLPSSVLAAIRADER